MNVSKGKGQNLEEEFIMKTMKIRNWRIQFNKSGISGCLFYDGKVLPRWGCGMTFIIDEHSVRYDYPEVVPEYVKEKLEAIRENIYG